MPRPVQYFSPDYLKSIRGTTPAQALRFLEDFRALALRSKATKSRLISLRVPEPLLEAFKAKAAREGIPYQTRIKVLMRAWLD